MILHDAEVDGGVAHDGKERLRLYLVSVVQDESELLLVDCGGGEQGGFHAVPEPSGKAAGLSYSDRVTEMSPSPAFRKDFSSSRDSYCILPRRV